MQQSVHNVRGDFSQFCMTLLEQIEVLHSRLHASPVKFKSYSTGIRVDSGFRGSTELLYTAFVARHVLYHANDGSNSDPSNILPPFILRIQTGHMHRYHFSFLSYQIHTVDQILLS